jgi:hypothetical protein
MWQRLQTVFLAIVVVIMIVSIFLPLWKHADAGGVRYELYPLHYSIINGDTRTAAYFPYSLTAVFMVASATLAIMTIRRYDNRIVQIKMGAVNTLFLMGVMIASVYFSNKLTNEFQFYGTSSISLWVIFVAVAANWLAMRFIRRDEKLVRDSDRLR